MWAAKEEVLLLNHMLSCSKLMSGLLLKEVRVIKISTYQIFADFGDKLFPFWFYVCRFLKGFS